MRIEHRLRGVAPAVAGRNAVPLDRLRRALGPRAFHVWQVLLNARNPQGLTRVGVREVANTPGFVAIKERNAKYGIARLEAAGLVERIGWRRETKRTGPRVVQRHVFERRVLGAILLGGTEASVHDSTVRWMSDAASWGGTRVGAGRKPAQDCSAEANQVCPRVEPEIGQCIQANQVCPTPFKCALDPPCFGESSVPDLVTSNSRKENWMGSSKEEEQRADARGGFSLSSVPGVGLVLGGNCTGGPPTNAGLPRYPGASLIAPALVPPPPRLAGLDADRAADLLAASYRGAVTDRLGTACHVLRRGASRSKWSRLLGEAAALLEQFDVAPAAWAAFSIAHWKRVQEHAPSARRAMAVPPISWVYSSKRLLEKLSTDAGRVNAEEYAQGGRAVMGKTYRLLLEDYTRMRNAVTRGMSKPDAVKKFFPGTRYDDLVDAAKAEAVEARYRMEEKVKRGDWLW